MMRRMTAFICVFYDSKTELIVRRKLNFRYKKAPYFYEAFLFGAGTKSRTRDLLITSQLLYQLSYTGNGGYYIDSKCLVKPFFKYI